MSKCVYTGAQVYFVEYGYIVAADIYRCGDCYIIRWNNCGGDSSKFNYVKNELEEHRCTHQAYLNNNFGNWHRDDIGVTVVHRDSIHGEMRE